jgi:ABC-type antimicrobial peptide transport system permease subunit
MGRNAPLVLLGVGLGLVGSLASARFIQGLLFGISPWDPLNYIQAALVVALVMTVAVLVPARRASRTDPVASINERI